MRRRRRAGGATGTAGATSGASANWVGQTVALQDARSSISVPRPANQATGDFLLVSVTAEGLGGGNICAPDDAASPGRCRSRQRRGSGATSITQATFSSTRATTDPGPYAFTFRTGGCPSGGNPISGVSATAVDLRYTGIDPVNPVDQIGEGPATGRRSPPHR